MALRINRISVLAILLFFVTCSQSEIEYQMKSQRDKCKDGIRSEGKKDIARVDCSVALPALIDNSLVSNRSTQGINSFNLLLTRCLLAIHKLNQCEDKSSVFP